MKIFWSWQSDIDGKISRHFIKECLTKAVEELKGEAVFDDRTDIDHDTKNIPGSPPIAETILEKIKNCDVFVADVTPVAIVETSHKKIMNPNVAIETGYAIALVGDKNIISVLNNTFGDIQDLPFDLKYKRGPVTYSLKKESEKVEIEAEQKKLVNDLKIVLKSYANIDKGVANSVNDHAIFFKEDEPIFRLSNDGWGALRDKTYLFDKTKTYIYTKVLPKAHLNIPKIELKKAMFNDGQFRLYPLLSSPSNTPETNKYGSVVVKFNPEKNLITDFTQILQDGSIIAISTVITRSWQNKLYLFNLRNNLDIHLKQCLQVMKKYLGNEEAMVEIEIGLINGDSCSIIRPKPLGNRFYPNSEVGPLENDEYKIIKRIKLKNAEEIPNIIKEFIHDLLTDIGIEFNYEDHEWINI